MKLSLLTDGRTSSVFPNFLSWKPLKTAWAVCSLKVKLRHGLRTSDLDLGLLIVSGNYSRIGEKLGVGIFVQRLAPSPTFAARLEWQIGPNPGWASYFEKNVVVAGIPKCNSELADPWVRVSFPIRHPEFLIATAFERWRCQPRPPS